MGFPGGSVVNNPSAMQKAWVWPLGQEDPPEKEMATHSSMLVWEIPWTEDPGEPQSKGCKRVGHDLGTKEQQFFEKSNLKYTSGVGSVENGVSLALKY